MESGRWNKSSKDLFLEIRSTSPTPLGIRTEFFRPTSDNASNEENGFRNA